jgi:hypothetical protein
MFCIASFIVLFILGIFSARYRKLAGKAWRCTLRRVTFRPCDVNFGEEMKGRILGELILTHPRWYRFFGRWFDVLAFIFVFLTVWSVASVTLSGLNLLVYDTCNPHDAESCSLSGEACSVSQVRMTLFESVLKNEEWSWIKSGVVDTYTAFSLVPSRFKHWEPEQYASVSSATYYPADTSKPSALIIIDPSCRFCAKEFGEIMAARFVDRYNVSYIAYPIPDGKGGYKFPYSRMLTEYLYAVRMTVPMHSVSDVPADWRFLGDIFTAPGKIEPSIQDEFNVWFDEVQAMTWIKQELSSIGYTDDQISAMGALVDSGAFDGDIAQAQAIVEQDIKTVKIPTLMFGGRRYDRVVSLESLQ